MPLEVADPEDEFGDGGSTEIEFDAEELVGIDGVGGEVEAEIGTELEGEVDDFAFEAFEVFSLGTYLDSTGWVPFGFFLDGIAAFLASFACQSFSRISRSLDG